MTPEYDSLDDYLKDFMEDWSLAVMPVPVVAEHLNRTPAAITAMIRAGKLEEVRIKKNKFVKVASLLDMQEEFNRQVETVMVYLEKLARKGIRKVYYEPVMAEVGMSPSVPADRTKIGAVLGAVSRRSQKERKVLLSVLVHRKTLGTTNPGPGFYGLARDLGYDCEDGDNDFVEKQTDRVMRSYKG